MTTITAKEKEKLEAFKELVSDILDPSEGDEDVVRWLRARNFDLKKSEEMIRKSIKWRRTWGADTILSWKLPEVLEKYDIGGMCGFDKEGCPIWIYPSARLDMKGLVMSAKKDDILKCYIQKLERNLEVMKEQSIKHGRRIDKSILINDLENFTMAHLLQPGMAIKLKLTHMIESNYPETLKTAYIINAPSIFPLIYRLLKPFINEPTRKRIVILGKDWKTKLQEVIEPSQLPVYWGGTMTDPVDGNPHCSSLVKLGGPIPSSYYIQGSHLVADENITRATVPARDSLKLQFNVTQEKQVLKYTFWTEKYDIKFGINYIENGAGDATESIISLHKAECQLVPEDGTVECEKPGTYEVVFDNAFSWFHSKQLSYYIYVLDPDKVEQLAEEEISTSDEATEVANTQQT